MRFAAVYKDAVLIADEVELADNFIKRFFGLMFRKKMALNHGLLLIPCSSIHTFSMRFPIDAVFLSKDNVILHIEHAMKPEKAGKKIKNTASVLELCSGTAEKFGLHAGETLKITKRNR